MRSSIRDGRASMLDLRSSVRQNAIEEDDDLEMFTWPNQETTCRASSNLTDSDDDSDEADEAAQATDANDGSHDRNPDVSIADRIEALKQSGLVQNARAEHRYSS